MRVALGTIEVSDEHRRAIRERLGRPGLATRREVQRFVLSNGMLALDDLVGSDE